MILALGALDDFDSTYFNGVEVGHTDVKTANWRQTPRNYVVPGKLVKAGKNVIAVRLFNRFGEGGFVGNKALAAGRPAGTPRQHGPARVACNVPESQTGGRRVSRILLSRLSSRISRWEIIPTATTGGRHAFLELRRPAVAVEGWGGSGKLSQRRAGRVGAAGRQSTRH